MVPRNQSLLVAFINDLDCLYDNNIGAIKFLLSDLSSLGFQVVQKSNGLRVLNVRSNKNVLNSLCPNANKNYSHYRETI